MFNSSFKEVGGTSFPHYDGTRVMMMPFELSDPTSLPANLDRWRTTVFGMADGYEGIGYLTIDEQFVKGRTHRRPGVHVDGIGPDSADGAWGIGMWAARLGGWSRTPGAWGKGPGSGVGMLQASSHIGCQAWEQNFEGFPAANGDCAHLAGELGDPILLEAKTVYAMTALTVHEGLVLYGIPRQFIRISMPSDAPWYEGYTPNPLGIEPTGPIHSPRPRAFMEGRNG